MKWTVLVLLIVMQTMTAQARLIEKEINLSSMQSWSDFSSAMQEQEKRDKETGFAYMLSGALLTLGGSIGYHNAKTSVEKLAFSVTQSLGIAGVGYGATLYHVGHNHRAFYKSIDNVPSLSDTQKDDIFLSYAREMRSREVNSRWIRVVSHSLVAAINIYNGSREEDESLRQGLYFIGAANAFAAFSLYQF